MAGGRAQGERDVRVIFKEKLQTEWTQKAACKRNYILVHRLKAWMNGIELGEKLNNAGRLLQAVYNNHPRHQFQPVDSSSISRSSVVFAILLKHDLGDLVHHFLKANITDDVLRTPSPPYQTLQHFLRDEKEYARKLTEIFDKDRWAFCPVEIRPEMDQTYLYDKQIVPFCKRQTINEKGGTAQVFQVLLQEDFVSDDLRETMDHSRVEDEDFGTCYQFALKSYRAEDFFDWETMAFKALKDQEGMVQCICSYSLPEYSEEGGGKVLTRTHNILLEFGEFDLDEFFLEFDSPVHPLEIIGFWKKFFKVADALYKLHYLNFQNRDGQQEPLHGWHSDLKPDNILRVHGEFKLADFGFAKFKKRHQDAPKEYIEGGTQSYGSPELDKARRDRGTRTPVSQTIDTWSFGCVLSVTVTWAVLGHQGIFQFEKLRRNAISSLRERHSKGEKINTPVADDAFHNGSDVLPEVLEWFDYLHHGLRRSDFVCGRILDLVREAMLLKDPDKRLKSPALCRRLEEILDLAQRDLDKQLNSGVVSQITNTIFKILQDDVGTGSKPSSSAIQTKSLNTSGTYRYKAGLYPSSEEREPKASKRFGKSERFEKRPALRTDHRAAQHPQAIPHISKRSTGASSISNQAIPEAWSESPTEATKPAQSVSISADIPPLPPKADPTSESNGLTRFVPGSSPPPFIVTTPEKEGTPISAGSVPPTQAADLSVNAAPYEEKKTAPHTPPPVDSGSPHGTLSSTRNLPILDPNPSDNCLTLQASYPNLEIFQHRNALDARKAGKSLSLSSLVFKPKKDAFLEKFIKNRDIIFVFDNAASMTRHWPIATYTAETLAMKVANLDEDGVDYVFTSGGQKNDIKTAKRSNAGQTIRKAMTDADPEAFLEAGMQPLTDMGNTLHAVFNHYMQEGKMKTITLLVFTDGVWRDTEDKVVETKIKEFAGKFQKRANTSEGRFSIQFISFGRDAKGIARLQYLDDDLGKDYEIHDMIDTEPWSGKVHKMILGSIEEKQFQDDEGESSGGLDSPPFRTPSRAATAMTEGKAGKKRISTLWKR